jgi:hypothetical protein
MRVRGRLGRLDRSEIACLLLAVSLGWYRITIALIWHLPCDLLSFFIPHSVYMLVAPYASCVL